MKLETLSIQNFRNIEDFHGRFSPSVNVFLGENGQGKTNILEAIHFITRGNSFRPGHAENFINHKALEHGQNSHVVGTLEKSNLDYQIEFKLGRTQRSFRLNGKRTSSAALNRSFSAILFSPESLAAIKEGPEQRRQLVDEFLVQHKLQNSHLLQQFKKALRHRNQLLKNRLKQDIDDDDFEKTLCSLNPRYFELATAVTVERIQGLKKLWPQLRQAMAFISNNQNVDISVDYMISEQMALEWTAQEIHSCLVQRGAQLRGAEMSSGTSLVGPQKHDIRINFSGHDSRYYCSQGQQRALILSYKMAQIVYHYRVYQTYPVLLLDDVMSELDVAKRHRLVEFLQDINAQIFITTTDFDLSREWGAEQVEIFQIKDGRVLDTSSCSDE